MVRGLCVKIEIGVSLKLMRLIDCHSNLFHSGVVNATLYLYTKHITFIFFKKIIFVV